MQEKACQKIVIPPHAGRDRLPAHNEAILRNFNPPAPCGAGPLIPRPVLDTVTFQSTRPLRGGTGRTEAHGGSGAISIHPPLAGRDSGAAAQFAFRIYFNPPAPCGAGPQCARHADAALDFNPPAPCGAGRGEIFGRHYRIYFNPPAHCGAGHRGPCRRLPCPYFNPPAPCGAGLVLIGTLKRCGEFQSTRPLWGGTRAAVCCTDWRKFQSTRPLRGGTNCKRCV